MQVYLEPWGSKEPAVLEAAGQQAPCSTSGQQTGESVGTSTGRGSLLERWTIQYEQLLPETGMQRTRSQLARLDPPAIYKRLVRHTCDHGRSFDAGSVAAGSPAGRWLHASVHMGPAQGVVMTRLLLCQSARLEVPSWLVPQSVRRLQG